MINFKGLTRAQVLAGLYNGSRPQGMGFLQYKPGDMTENDAEELLKKRNFFDYLYGRVMKVEIGEEDFEEGLYDRDNGSGAAQRVIDALRQKNMEAIKEQHDKGTLIASALVMNRVNEQTRITKEGEFEVVTLGLADVKDELTEATRKAIEGKRGNIKEFPELYSNDPEETE